MPIGYNVYNATSSSFRTIKIKDINMRKIIINTPEQEQPIVNVDPTPVSDPTPKTSKKKDVPTDETTSSS
jgi:hypothetical protein